MSTLAYQFVYHLKVQGIEALSISSDPENIEHIRNLIKQFVNLADTEMPVVYKQGWINALGHGDHDEGTIEITFSDQSVAVIPAKGNLFVEQPTKVGG